MSRPTNADLEEIAAGARATLDALTLREMARELLAKRRQLRVARSVLLEGRLWPIYEAELKAKRRRPR